jgi:hypothetical protein
MRERATKRRLADRGVSGGAPPGTPGGSAVPELPPPDPYESFDLEPDDREVGAPTAIFAGGPVTPEVDRVADRLLDLRPGLLIVFARA